MALLDDIYAPVAEEGVPPPTVPAQKPTPSPSLSLLDSVYAPVAPGPPLGRVGVSAEQVEPSWKDMLLGTVKGMGESVVNTVKDVSAGFAGGFGAAKGEPVARAYEFYKNLASGAGKSALANAEESDKVKFWQDVQTDTPDTFAAKSGNVLAQTLTFVSDMIASAPATSVAGAAKVGPLLAKLPAYQALVKSSPHVAKFIAQYPQQALNFYAGAAGSGRAEEPLVAARDAATFGAAGGVAGKVAPALGKALGIGQGVAEKVAHAGASAPLMYGLSGGGEEGAISAGIGTLMGLLGKGGSSADINQWFRENKITPDYYKRIVLPEVQKQNPALAARLAKTPLDLVEERAAQPVPAKTDQPAPASLYEKPLSAADALFDKAQVDGWNKILFPKEPQKQLRGRSIPVTPEGQAIVERMPYNKPGVASETDLMSLFGLEPSTQKQLPGPRLETSGNSAIPYTRKALSATYKQLTGKAPPVTMKTTELRQTVGEMAKAAEDAKPQVAPTPFTPAGEEHPLFGINKMRGGGASTEEVAALAKRLGKSVNDLTESDLAMLGKAAEGAATRRGGFPGNMPEEKYQAMAAGIRERAPEIGFRGAWEAARGQGIRNEPQMAHLSNQIGGVNPEAFLETVKRGGSSLKYILNDIPKGDITRERIPEQVAKSPTMRHFVRMVDDVHSGTISKMGAARAELNEAMDIMPAKERRWVRHNFVDDYRLGKPMPDKASQKLADNIGGLMERVGNFFEAAEMPMEDGVIFKKRAGRYVPDILVPDALESIKNQSGPVYQGLLEQGFAPEILSKIGHGKMTTRTFSNLERHRKLDLPPTVTYQGKTYRVLDNDFRVVTSYLDNAARKVSIMEALWRDPETGVLNMPEKDVSGATTKRINAIIAKSVEEGVPYKVAETAIPRLWRMAQGMPAYAEEGTVRKMMPGAYKAFTALDDVLTSVQLSAAGIVNTTAGWVPEAVRMGFYPTAKAWGKAWTTSLRDASVQDVVKMSDLRADVTEGLEITQGLEGKTGRLSKTAMRLSGMKFANNRTNLAVTYGMAKWNLRNMVEAVASGESGRLRKLWGMDASAAERYLKTQLGFTASDVKRMAGGNVTQADVAMAANKQLDLVNVFREFPSARPAFVARPMWRIIGKYSSYQRKFYSTVTHATGEMKHGNMAPITRLLISATAGGEATIAIKNLLLDRQREDKNFATRLSRDLVEMGSFGLYGLVEYPLRNSMRTSNPEKAKEEFAKLLVPPTIEGSWDIGVGVMKAIKQEDLAPFWRTFKKQFSAGRMVESIAKRDDPSYIAERLAYITYLNRSKDGKHAALDGREGSENTVKELIGRLKKQGMSDYEILTLIRKKRDEMEAKPEDEKKQAWFAPRPGGGMPRPKTPRFR